MKKILIVDDAEVQRFQLSATLEAAGYHILTATNGEEGLIRLRENPDVDLIISDLYMPGMDGLTMCAEIRNSEDLCRPPVFMITTEASSELKQQAKQVGIIAWIIKPFDSQKLLSAVSRLFAQT